MKVGFYLQNEKINGVDCSQPLNGNPGIGGTEYMFVAIPYCLHSLFNEKKCQHETVLIANDITNLPKDMTCVEAASDALLADVVEKQKIDIVVIRYSYDNYLMACQLQKTKVVMWAHNFVKRTELSLLAKSPKIVAVVCVGTEQLHFYRDHLAFRKSVLIRNGYPVQSFIQKKLHKVFPFELRKNEVTYLGNLVEYKGFHLLAEAWGRVIKEVPDAHLNVIGGGKLYDRKQKLGKWNIAEQEYEDMFMPYLLDESGNLLPSVKFWGVLGHEKDEILNHTKVGIPNPSGVSETFCIAALEMQLWGGIIATINYGGFKDTVYTTGILYNSPDDLASAIIRQLKKQNNDYCGFLKFAKNFDFNVVAKDWIILFDTIQSGCSLEKILKPQISLEHNLKEWNRKIKRYLPFGKCLPTIAFYQSIFYRIRNLFGVLK